MTNGHSKNVGAYIDRNYRFIKLTFLNLFKKIDVDLTTDQWLVIDVLHQNGTLSLNDLSEKTFKNPATMSRIVGVMISKDLVRRELTKKDKRRLNIKLTNQGELIFEKTIKHVEKLRHLGWEGLSESDFREFLRLMNSILENYSKMKT